jgi:NarL family two-component system response regulator LiaR
MRILIVDDHPLFREGLLGLLNAQPGFSVVGQAGSVAEAIALARELEPDLILMDFGLPDGTGLDATQAILADLPKTHIVFLTVHEEDERLFAAIRSGAKGYLLKNIPASKLLSYLRAVEHGEAALSGGMTSRILSEFTRLSTEHAIDRVEMSELTWRELEVLRQVATGASNQEIAKRLVISENTVKNHVSNILEKLNLRNRREAADFARRHRLVESTLDRANFKPS